MGDKVVVACHPGSRNELNLGCQGVLASEPRAWDAICSGALLLQLSTVPCLELHDPALQGKPIKGENCKSKRSLMLIPRYRGQHLLLNRLWKGDLSTQSRSLGSAIVCKPCRSLAASFLASATARQTPARISSFPRPPLHSFSMFWIFFSPDSCGHPLVPTAIINLSHARVISIPAQSSKPRFFFFPRSRRSGQGALPPSSILVCSPTLGPGLAPAIRMTALQNFPQFWRRLVFLLPVLVISLILATGLYNGSIPKPSLPKVFNGGTSSSPIHQSDDTPTLGSLPDVIRALWAPLVLPITAPTFTTIDGEVKHLPPPEELIHTKPLGKRVCILDLDNRKFDGNGSIFGEQLPRWEDLDHPGAGFLSHYLYAMIHGYSYKFIRSPKYADRAPHWSKVVFTRELLKEYDIVVMLDYDAMFPTPEVPLEWLLNYWRIGPEVLVAMAEDPAGDPNFDVRHKPNINSGFIIAQAGKLTQRLFKDWAECPEEQRYPGCGVWKDKPFHEQSAFSSHVRYDFLDGYSIDTHPQYIRMLPCKEANGTPEVAGCGCIGQLVRHYWGHKHLTNRELTHSVMAAFTPLLVQTAYKQPGYIQDLRSKVLNGAQVLD